VDTPAHARDGEQQVISTTGCCLLQSLCPETHARAAVDGMRSASVLACCSPALSLPLAMPALSVGRVDPINDEIYKKGCIVKEKTELTGMCALHKACQYGRLNNVEKLIQEGANVNEKNHW